MDIYSNKANTDQFIRKLGSFESGTCITTSISAFNIIIDLSLAPFPSADRVRNALQRIVVDHPFLSCAIIEEKHVYSFFHRHLKALPFMQKHVNGEEEVTQLMEREINELLPNQDGSLFRCTWVETKDSNAPGHIIFALHHAIFDGACLAPFLTRFMKYINLDGEVIESKLDGTTPQDQPIREKPETNVQVLDATESYLPDSYFGLNYAKSFLKMVMKEMKNECAYRLIKPKGPKLPFHPRTVCKSQSIIWNEEETARLLKTTRLKRTSALAVLHAAMLLAVNRVFFEQRPHRHRFIAFYDLRPYLKPPVPAEPLGAHLAMARFSQVIQPDVPFWDLANEIQEKIYQMGKSGDKFIVNRMTEGLMKMTKKMESQRMASTAISYTGHLTNLQDPEHHYRLIDVHAHVSNINSGPFYTANSRIYQGCLTMDCLYLDTDMNANQADQLAEALKATVNAASSQIDPA